MSGEQLPQSNEQPRSLLGGMLSMEFSDCSIAAADLSKQAADLLKDYNKLGAIKVIGQEIDTLEFVSTDIVAQEYSPFTIDGYPKRLALVQRIQKQENKQTSTVKRRWLPDKTVEFNETKNTLTDDPYLGIYITGGTILPLASFARRKDGQCSYVQFGREMNDDNFYVTQADDESSRHELVEALRTIFSGPIYALKERYPHETELVQSFINAQTIEYCTELLEAYERQFAELCFSKISEVTAHKNLKLIESGELNQPQPYKTRTIIPGCILQDGRTARLAIAQHKDNSDRFELIAETRTDIAAKLATVSKDLLAIEFNDYIDLAGKRKRRILQDLIYNLTTSQELHHRGGFKRDYNWEELSDQNKEIAQYLETAGILSKYETRSDSYSYRKEKVEVSLLVKNVLDNFLTHPLESRQPFEDSPPLELAMKRLLHKQNQDRVIFETLNAQQSLSEILGEVRDCDEVLMKFVAKLSGKKMTAIFKDYSIGKTRSDAVAITANVKKDDGVYELTIGGRPVSMPDEPMKHPITLRLDTSRPYLGHELDLNDQFHKDNVLEIVDVLSRIVNANNT